MDWSAPTTREIMARRAGGRRHYNSCRRFCAAMRRKRIVTLLPAYGWRQARVARALGVSESTVSRDLDAMGWRELARAGRWLRGRR